MASNIETKVEELIKPVIESINYSLYDVLYEKEGKDFYLRVIIDKEGTIDINDCEKVNNAITDLLDDADYIKDQYFLEVSSPGLERNLRKEEHFLKQIGNEISVKLYNKVENQKELIGILKEYNSNGIILEFDEKKVEIECKNIAAAKTVYEW